MHTSIYSIPFNDCDKYYFGETKSNLDKRIYEEKQSIKLNDDRNALLSHMLDFKHTFKCCQATLIKLIYYINQIN